VRNIIYPTFLRKRTVGEGDPFHLKFWVNQSPLQQNLWFWTNICQ